MPALELSSLKEFVQAGAASIRWKSLRISVPCDSECEATDYYAESNFGDMNVLQIRPDHRFQSKWTVMLPYLVTIIQALSFLEAVMDSNVVIFIR
jgi:hypothetical protein